LGFLISDIGMPGEDGYELIRQVRARADGRRNTKALALSAFARTEDQQRAIQSGFDGFLSKPLDGQELIGTIELLVNRTKKE
jgi:CheY-like chemotaxis protein